VPGGLKEVIQMAQIQKDMKRLLFRMGPKFSASNAVVMDWLGIACLVIGIVASARGTDIALGATNWLLIAIALWVYGLWAWLAGYLGAKEG
jgi:hypothetical protein